MQDLTSLIKEIEALAPGVTQNDDGSYTAVVIHQPAGENGSTVFKFSEIERLRRSEFNAFVEVMVHHEKEIKRFSGRLNLASMSSREGFVRSLERITGRKKEFDSYLSQAIEGVNQKLNDIPRSQSVMEIEPITGNMMLFAPFITDKSANLIFGDGSSTKSYICIHLAISLVTGLPYAGFYPARKANVLFLDYEDVGGKFADRVNRIAGGMPVQPDLEDLKNLRYMKAKGVALHEMVPQLKEEILKHNIELLVIDSAAYACGAEIEKADAVIRYFNALETLGVASLAIAHVTKSSTEAEGAKVRGQQHAIGSIYFHNGPRNIWNVVKAGDENDQEPVKKVCMFHRKCNDATLSKFVPIEVDFTSQSTTKIRKGNEADWEEAKDLASRIVAFLRAGMKDRKAIEDEFSNENKNTIKVTLRRLKAANRIRQYGGEKGDYCLPMT